jgi:hypothetical protein
MLIYSNWYLIVVLFCHTLTMNTKDPSTVELLTDYWKIPGGEQ